MNSFSINAVPALTFGRGSFHELAKRASSFGTRILLVGDQYLQDHPSLLKDIINNLVTAGLIVEHVHARGKQTQEASNKIEARINLNAYDCIVSIGGGRAIDIGKLLSKQCPHIAVPTTAGTGAAMNAIIFGGDDALQETHLSILQPDMVLADPSFLDEMDRDGFAARALGVLMLLTEAYISPKASVFSDALVWSGLEAFAQGFVKGVEGDTNGRDRVFYASLIAGIASPQTGFGLTHRLAATIEQNSKLSYAQAGATICAEITDLQISYLGDFLPDHPAMDKYALIGELLAERPFEDREEAYASLIGTLRRWISRLALPKLPLKEAILRDVIQHVLKGWDNETLPIAIAEEDLLETLLRRHQ